MIYSSLNLLFLMSVILLMSGLHFPFLGTAGKGHVTGEEPVLAPKFKMPGLIEVATDLPARFRVGS